MDLISLILVLVVIGILLWAINTYIPMAEPIKTIINVVVIVTVLLWLIQIFGGISFRVPTIHR